MPTPNFIPSSVPPAVGGLTSGLDFWFDTTNGALNALQSGVGPQGQPGWLPITNPAVSAALNASVVSVGRGQFEFIPAVVGSLGVSLPNIPPGQVGCVYDVVGQRLYVVGSGGVTTKSVLFA